MSNPCPKKPGDKGSQAQIRTYVNERKEELNQCIISALPSLKSVNARIRWKSPLKSDSFNEYRDEDFLEAVELKYLVPELVGKFWPQNGPCWDALAAVDILAFPPRKGVILVEAKANLQEINSNCENGVAKGLWKKTSAIQDLSLPVIAHFLEQGKYSKGARCNLVKICDAFNNIKRDLGVQGQKVYGDNDDKCDLGTKIFYTWKWLYGYYQTANRLAMLYFLSTHGIPAQLLFIYFTGDNGSASRTCPKNEKEWLQGTSNQHGEWQKGLDAEDKYLGLAGWKDNHLLVPKKSLLYRRVHRIFLPAVGNR